MNGRARVLMVQGSMSSVGKSLMVAALCRIFHQDGIRVAPFKAQNMALNSFVTRDGLEIGRAQAMQADAAGIDITVEMNPVLIKPEADAFAQYVVLGKPWARLGASEYMLERRRELWDIVTAALDSLRARYELVVIEGAGSPAELNLRRGDLVNMAIAEYAGAPVLLVGDIDRGGIFAQLLGTLALLTECESARVKGFIVNKFRGDARLFTEGVKILEARSGVPVLGVMPYLYDLRIADEDSVVLQERHGDDKSRAVHIAVIHLPHMSNFDDFDPLRAEPDVRVSFIERADELENPDLIILPGTKMTVADLSAMRERGLAQRVVELARAGVPLFGICGGYQMLGEMIYDPQHVESAAAQVHGLGLLPLQTLFEADKLTVRARGQILADDGLFAHARGMSVDGYEIHMGRTKSSDAVAPLVQVTQRGGAFANDCDGASAREGWIAGTYLHGFFDNDGLRAIVLNNLAARRGWARDVATTRFERNAEYERLAATVRAHLNMDALYRISGFAA